MMKNILVAGASGFYGNILVRYLQNRGYKVFGVDIVDNVILPPDQFINLDLKNFTSLERLFFGINFEIIINLATMIDFDSVSQSKLYQNNIEVTKNLAIFGTLRKTKIYIYTSSNSIFLGNKVSIISNNEIPQPIDSYGKSKVDSEKILEEYKKFFSVIVFRCPNIMDVGRLGMLTILFELIKQDATLWVVDGGKYRHQCLYAQDLNNAIELSFKLNGFYIFNIGADQVESFKEMFKKLILKFNGKSRIRGIPKALTIISLKFLHFLKLSPMGPYQLRMLTSNFEFDTSYVKSKLGWQPTLSTAQILEIACKSYFESYANLNTYNNGANGKPIKMGVLKLLTYIKF